MQQQKASKNSRELPAKRKLHQPFYFFRFFALRVFQRLERPCGKCDTSYGNNKRRQYHQFALLNTHRQNSEYKYVPEKWHIDHDWSSGCCF
ncbi:MAG: hypothetical protein ACD_39C01723G0001 [uncultured bacterium]|nr:MAG: hypothetical protein ACD_39C01723G0001 [uncultured bacterium]